LLRAAESGFVPDTFIRLGIRQLLRSRRHELERRSSDFWLNEFVESASRSPIAVVPEKANAQHYEVPAAFFEAVLGPQLKYSCCYWDEGVGALDVAEEESLRRTCSNAGLRDGMEILELGCGWGSPSLWMAEQYPNSLITSVSNSQSQRHYIQQQAESRGLTNLAVITADMNDFAPDQQFDRVVSVEMFEHMRNHRELLQRIHDWLRPGGRLLVHVFCHRQTPYLFETDGDNNWMGRYFFTGGMMPSVDLLPTCSDSLALIQQWKWDGQHYAKTCRAWLQNQDAASDRLKQILSDCYGASNATRWHQRWRLFFMACEELFAFSDGQEWFVSHYLFERCPDN
jgi:cyclopropane-fatty-acyl-phospholipid synthase